MAELSKHAMKAREIMSDHLDKATADLTLKQQIQKALGLPDSDFHTHASDLYVLWSAELAVWLRENYEFYKNIESFTGAKGSNWAGKRAFDIPFACHVSTFKK